MTMTTMRHTGRAAAASGILMLAGIEGEWLLNPQADDGTVTNLPVFTLLLLTATTGFVMLLLAVRGLRAQTTTTKSARAGSLITLVGAALMLSFGVTVLVSALITGSPLEIAFLAFLIGMLLLAVGPITWALALRRHSPAPGAWQMLLLSGAAAFAALALEADPWHDLALATMFTAWTILGVLLRRRTNATTPTSPTRASSHA